MVFICTTVSVSNTQLHHEITITITNIDSPLFTHMLAIYSQAEKIANKIQVILFFIHNIFVAAHYAHVSQLHYAAQPMIQVVSGTQITISVISFFVMHPESFPILITYLYVTHPEVFLLLFFSVAHSIAAAHSLEKHQL